MVNFTHDGSDFANALTTALRDQGLGVAHGHEWDYLDLHYRIEALNPAQFHVTVALSDGRQLSRIWVVTQNQLVPLKTRAYGVVYE
ncbi:hypothetical protein JCM19233_3074 [Vibrio astriarenae]|nr:hypothetical protein JCM19233_3074 [Vibrio sp. C7]